MAQLGFQFYLHFIEMVGHDTIVASSITLDPRGHLKVSNEQALQADALTITLWSLGRVLIHKTSHAWAAHQQARKN